MDIIGAQIKDGKLRIGHPGKSTFNISTGLFSFGPQNDVYEDFGVKNREEGETSYWDAGFSRGHSAILIFGYHYDFSISIKGIVQDLINYFS